MGTHLWQGVHEWNGSAGPPFRIIQAIHEWLCIGLRSSPPRKVAKTPGAGSSSLVRNVSDDESDDQPAVLATEYDTVTDEASRWAALDARTIREFRDDEGIVNEFALVYHLRQSFPLHFIVFKQTASHLPHEGNTEQLFSRSGALSDDNGKMDPAHLGVWTSIGVNMSTTSPRPSRSSSATCSSSARAARPPWPRCIKMTRACLIQKGEKAGTTWSRLAAARELAERERERERRDYLVQAGSS